MIPWVGPNLPGDGQLAPRISWEVQLPLESKERISYTPTTGLSAKCKNSCKISWKLPITESDYRDAGGATLLKSLSAANIVLGTLQELEIFLSHRTAQKGCYCSFFK